MFLKVDVDNLSLMCHRALEIEESVLRRCRIEEIKDNADKAKTWGIIYTMISENEFNLVFKEKNE